MTVKRVQRSRLIAISFLLLLTVAVSEASYNFTVRFYEFRNPLGLQCGECGTSGGPPACCDDVQRRENCNMTRPFTCDTRFRFLLRPFGSSVNTAPNTGFPHFTPSNGDNSETFNERPNGLFGLPNPFTFNSIMAWPGRIQFFIDAVDRPVMMNTSGLSETLAIINRFPIDLELDPGTNFTERTTYTGIYNISGVGFDMSFRVQCADNFFGPNCCPEENYFGPNCTTFCEPVEGVYTCDREGRVVCINDDYSTAACIIQYLAFLSHPMDAIQCFISNNIMSIFDCLTSHLTYDEVSTICTECLMIRNDTAFSYNTTVNYTTLCALDYDQLETVCTQTECSRPGYDVATNCTLCSVGRNYSTGCEECFIGYDPSSNCTTCLSGRDIAYNCTECIAGFDILTDCTECVYRGLDPLTDCTSCQHQGQDLSLHCTECLSNFDPSTNCSACFPGLDIHTNCTVCLYPQQDPSTNCTTCLQSNREPSSNCTTCLPYYDPATDCSTCLPGRESNSNCTECITGLDIGQNCTACIERKKDPSTNCTTCQQLGQDISFNCAKCLPNYDPSTNCFSCLSGWDISTNCSECLQNRNKTNGCRTCNSGSVLIGTACISVDPCASRPCQNGGTCHAIYALTAAGYYCVCRAGYGGLLCQLQQIGTQTITSPDTENARAGENKPVIIVGGALGGFLGLLIAAAVLMTMIAVYLGCQLRLVHKKSPVNDFLQSEADSNVDEQFQLQGLQEEAETNNSDKDTHAFHNPVYDSANEKIQATSQGDQTSSELNASAQSPTGVPTIEQEHYDVAYPQPVSTYDLLRPTQDKEREEGDYDVTVHEQQRKAPQSLDGNDTITDEHDYADISESKPKGKGKVGGVSPTPGDDYEDASILMLTTHTS